MILTDVGHPQVEYWGKITTHKHFGMYPAGPNTVHELLLWPYTPFRVEGNGISVLVKSSCVAQLTRYLSKRLSLNYFISA